MIVPQADVQGGIAGVVSSYYGSSLEKEFEICYVESYCDGSKWRKLRKALGAYLRFIGVLWRFHPQIVHIHSSFGPSFFRKMPFILLSAAGKIPVINHIHGSAFDEFFEKAPEGKKKLVRYIYGKCSRIIVLTDFWRDKISMIVPAERIEVVPNYSRSFPEAIRNNQMRFDGRQILFLGVITPGKGLHEMPAVIRNVVDRVPDARFVIAGTGDTEYLYEHLQDGYKDHVLCPGWVTGSEKEKLLKESMLFFLPSHMEAMPMSALEAMGYGLPVVSTNAGGIPFVVKDGYNGKLADVGAVREMADAICGYLEDRSAFQRASENSLQLAGGEFSLEAHLGRLGQIWNEVLKETNSRSAAG